MTYRIGFIGCDTSHVKEFAQRLNDPKNPEHVEGATVVAAYPGGSPDFEMSISRVPALVKELRDKFDVVMMDSPEEVADHVDLIFITAVDGRVHREMMQRTAKFHRPTFIDKPLATSSKDAQEIMRIAKENSIPVMSCSALRYADSLTTALESPGEVFGVDLVGPMSLQATQPGLFWYGIHTVELMNRIMGRGCREVRVITNPDVDLVTAVYPANRIATIRGLRKGHPKFCATLHRDAGPTFIDLSANKQSWYSSMLKAILRSIPAGKSDVAAEDTLEIIRIIEAANESRDTGKSIALT
jgi:predicted dehydrogenase